MLATGATAAPSRTGLEPTISVGTGGFFPSQSISSLAMGQRDPFVAIHVLLLYRVFPPIDLGLHSAHQWLAVSGLPAGASAYSSAAGGGMMTRFHPLSLANISWIDPSIGVGVDMFAYSRQTTRLTVPVVDEIRNAISGVALPLVLGLDFMVLDSLALSGTAMWGPWWFAEACSSQGTGLPACAPTTGTSYYYYLGLGLRLHLQFVE
jgi:hypothetical protein